MSLSNLPGVTSSKNDLNLLPDQATVAPRILIIGTAGQGQGHQAYRMTTTQAAKSEFGNDGTLIRGMWEALKQGATEVLLYRIGSTPATVEGIGNAAGTTNAGFTITTVEEDASAGENYSFYYDDATARLVVQRNSDDLVVYDNSSTAPIDYFEVVVSGYRDAGGGADVGSPSSLVNLEDVDGSTYPGASYTAGTDGLGLSRMEMYEQLYKAYKHLVESDFDVVVPMDIYLDDLNVVAQGHFKGAITPVVPVGQSYPTAGAFSPAVDVDSLGKVFVQEYEGEYYFWWDFNGDGVADVAPSVGSASTTTDVDGTTLTAADFHEVNFGYQLGAFLHEYSTYIVDATGVIGVLPPASNSLRDKSRWLGKSPTWTLDSSDGSYSIASGADNGTGLLGNKFMVGRSDHRSGAFGGGFIATDSGFMDGTELTDENDAPVDIGKYFSVITETPFLRNNWYPQGYFASFAASYGGFYLNMAPQSAPTNKKVIGTSVIYKMGLNALNDLVGNGYVVMREKTQGLVIADAPTASRPQSDWRRLSTVRIVKAIVDACRDALDPFLGEGTSGGSRTSMENKVEAILLAAKKEPKYLQDYKKFSVIQTPQMEVDGRATLSLSLVPTFELRQIDITINLSKSG